MFVGFSGFSVQCYIKPIAAKETKESLETEKNKIKFEEVLGFYSPGDQKYDTK